MKPNPYCNVVRDLSDLRSLGFVEDGFHNWNLILHESDISRSVIVANGDYLFLKNEKTWVREKGEKVRPGDLDLVTLWNSDIGGPISRDELKTLLSLLKKGNVRAKKRN